MTTTTTSSSARPFELARKPVSAWAAVLAAAAAAGLAFWAGNESGSPDQEPVQHGVIRSLESGEICIDTGDMLECYRAPGVGAKVGDQVTYVVSNELVDPHDPAKGKSPALVFLDD